MFYMEVCIEGKSPSTIFTWWKENKKENLSDDDDDDGDG